VNSYVYALAVAGTDLYVGGAFTTAGGQAINYVARAAVGPSEGRFSNCSYSPAGFSFTFSDATAGQPYRIQTSTSLANESWADFISFTYDAPLIITFPPISEQGRFFRAVSP
jgi:hypothetical protein